MVNINCRNIYIIRIIHVILEPRVEEGTMNGVRSPLNEQNLEGVPAYRVRV